MNIPVCEQFPGAPCHVLPEQVRRHSLSLFSQPITASSPFLLYQACNGGTGSEHPFAVKIVHQIRKLGKICNIYVLIILI